MPSYDLDHARIIAPPPLIFAIAIGLGVALDLYWPEPPLQLAMAPLPGGLMILFGLILGWLSLRQMRAAKTSANPYTATTAIICSGPYRFSRNPMYLALAIIQLGIALALGNVGIALTLPGAVLVMTYGVIAREEAYLARKFGASYRDYLHRVRRWL